MSERKSLNKHIDEKQQKIELEQKNQLKQRLKEQGLTIKDLKYEFHKTNKIRLMNPVPLICLSCGTYIPKYRKFNGYKREVNKQKEFSSDSNSNYLKKIKIFELKFKCFLCGVDIIIRTDPLKAAAIDNDDSLFKDDSGASDNTKKEDGFMIMSGAKRMQENEKNNDSKTANGNNQVDILLDSINREQKLEEEKILNEMNNAGVLEDQLTSMQKQQRDDEELEEMQRKEILKKMNIERMKKSKEVPKQENVDSNIIPINVSKEKVEVIKMVTKPKNKKKKKIIKL